MSGTLFAFAVAIAFALLEDKLVFRGLFSKHIEDSIKPFTFEHYVAGWLPLWWGILAFSFSAIGAAVACSIWAFVAELNGQPTATPILLGLASVIAAFSGMIVPIATSWFKDRSENRQLDLFKQRVVELQRQLDDLQKNHVVNKEHIQQVVDRMDVKDVKDGTTKEGN